MVSEHSAVKVADDLPFEIAVVFGCAVLTGAGTALNATTIAPGDAVAVFGLGGIGLAALMAAVDAGAPVIAVDRVGEKLSLARELGAAHAIEASDEVGEAVRELSAAGVAHAIETVGSAAVLGQAYPATRRGGTTVTVGLPHPAQQLTIPAVSPVTDERTLKGSYLGSCVPSRDIPRFVDLYRAGRLPVDRLITHRLTPAELNEGFHRLARGNAIRQVITV